VARLIIVTGASGAGKSFLLEQIQRLHSEISPVKKLTTRPPRNSEPYDTSLDLIFNCSDAEVKKCDYKYNYFGHNYGIKKSDIDNHLMSGVSPIVIVARCSVIERIKADYRDALVLYVQNTLSGSDLKNELIKQRDPIDIEERMKRQQDSFNDYIQNIRERIFDYILINNFTDAFMSQVQCILDLEQKRKIDANYIFVIMSFETQYNDVYSVLQNHEQ